MGALEFLVSNYQHSSVKTWEDRFEKGQIRINNILINSNQILDCGDLLTWDRPPWEEPGVPSSWNVIFDNGDVIVIDKPAGLQVTPGGGFLEHTLVELLKSKYQSVQNNLVPKPVHRLGRFTSGLLICARKKETRSILSSFFRNRCLRFNEFETLYRALSQQNLIFCTNKYIDINTEIVKCSHPLLGEVWNMAKKESSCNVYSRSKTIRLKSSSKVKLLERKVDSDLLEVNLLTGRPHQIRIHLSSVGSPLLGDQFYGMYGAISPDACPGEGGYFLNAHKIFNLPIGNQLHTFESNLPIKLRGNNEV